ncbi:MAG: hypothetical protein HOD64_12110, partial [Candidatus Cloacimonetes bacterium]|nr:hypothetical protein [Candidatus Cloacimonadota bacterium]
MKRLLILLLLIGTSNIYSITLKEVYKTAPTQGEYDKYLALETGVTYTGGLLIGPIYDPIIDELSGPQGLN